jgi:hypothetical protein
VVPFCSFTLVGDKRKPVFWACQAQDASDFVGVTFDFDSVTFTFFFNVRAAGCRFVLLRLSPTSVNLFFGPVKPGQRGEKCEKHDAHYFSMTYEFVPPARRKVRKTRRTLLFNDLRVCTTNVQY